MFNNERKVTVEWIENEGLAKVNGKTTIVAEKMTNPINRYSSDTSKLSEMVTTILDKELPMLKDNALLHELVLYTLLEKVKTVQTVENVLSYIKENNAKTVQDVYFKNGEVRIKCST